MALAVRTLDNFIGGSWVAATGDSARTIVSPVTGETLAEAPDASTADVDAAVAAARRAQPAWAARSAWERAEVCHAIAELIDERREEFARELTLEQGKPYASEALADIDETAENFRIAAEDVKRMETAVIPSQDPGKRILTFRRPNGVYAAITPWNFPTLIPVELIAPGIAAGNTIVIKPSEWTPLAMANFMRIMADAGLPEGVVNVIYGGGEVGARLVTHPDVDGIGFVGSHATAEKIVRAAGMKRSLIEASGNGPVIVCEDADLARAAQGAVFGGFFCAGQVCCATERVLVHERVHDAFLDEVLRAAAEWPLGDPFETGTKVGPMNNEPTARKMDAHLEDAVGKGAEVVLGGSRAGGHPTDLFYEPTVVTGVGLDTLINRDETFGPIVPLIRVASDDEALAAANDSHLGLQAAVYTSSLSRAFRYADHLRVGNVVVNDSTDYWEAHEPFGGAAGTQTGWGRIGGRYTMLDMTDLRTVVLDVGGGID
ncbi:MAG TPA: aldehyde dehydrogenase family protein [Gaiellaceae bacterium]|jgi:succinate-semialdehyde dehydrogenase/glutarate-semialdehyde dehydrogenase|nr:aldehyde dehydrogenase family protein [Gaiellaceae bacterium]